MTKLDINSQRVVALNMLLGRKKTEATRNIQDIIINIAKDFCIDSVNDMKEILGTSDDDFIQKLKELDKQSDEYKNELENFIDFTQKVQDYDSDGFDVNWFAKGLESTLNISSFVLQFKQY